MNMMFYTNIRSLLFVLTCLFSFSSIKAQYTATTLETGRWYVACAKDNAGNIYVTRWNGSNYEVAKYLNGNPANVSVIYSGLSSNAGNEYPWGLAVNSQGDVFVTNVVGTNWQIIKLARTSYTPAVIQQGRFFSALTVDASDNLLSIEYNSGTNKFQVVRYAAGAENGAGSVLYGNIATPAARFTYPWGIVTDSHNNIFFLDFHETNGGQLVKLAANTWTPTILDTGRFFSSLAIDASDNIYMSESINRTTAAHVVKYADPTLAATEIYSGLTYNAGFCPWGLTVMPSGDIYICDGGAPGDGRFLKLALPSTITVTGITRVDPSPTNAGTVRYNVTFSGSVSNVTTGSFSMAGTVNGSLANISGSGNSYTVTLNTGTTNGDLHIRVNGTGITPAPTNVPFNTPAAQVYTIDKTAPTITSVSVPANGYYKAGNTLTFTAYFSEPVQVSSSFTGSLPITIGSTVVQAAYVSGSTTDALVFRYTVQPGDNDMNGIAVGSSLALNGGTIRDNAGNNANLALNSVGTTSNVFVNTTTPSVTLSTTATSPVKSSFPITVTFSEAVTGLTMGDFSTTNAGLSGLSTTDNITYTVTVIPSADGTITISLPANIAQNIGGNNNAASNTLSMVADITAPTATSVDVPANGTYHGGDVLEFTVHFSENVIVNMAGGTPAILLQIGANTRNATYLSGTGTNTLVFRYTVLNNDEDLNGIQLASQIDLNGSTIRDAATNDASLLLLNNVPGTSGIIVELTKLTISISSSGFAANAASWTAILLFSEEVTDFTITDLAGTNATFSNLQTTDNIRFTVLVTPGTEGNVSIEVPGNVAHTILGVGNEQVSLSYYFDPNPPVITSVDVPANGYYKAGDNLDFTVHFNEIVRILNSPFNGTLPVTIGSTVVQARYVSGTNSNAFLFRYTVLDGQMDLNGIAMGNSLAINSHRLIDLSGNDVNPALNNVGNTSNVFVNTARPSVTLGAATTTVNGPFTVTITFSEAVTGFAIGDINAANATLSNLQTTNNISYTVLATPVANGTVSLSIPANVAQNIAGTGNSASNTVTYQFDNTPPVITSVDVPANGYYKAGQNLDFTVHFSETVKAMHSPFNGTLPVTIGTSVVQAAYVSGSNSNTFLFRYTVQNGEMDMDGIAVGNSIALNSHTIQDLSGNNVDPVMNSVGNTSGVLVNTAHPSVTLSTTAPARVNAAFPVTITFSEAVTGLTIADFTGNGTLGNLQTSNNITYTVQVTPAADGSVTLHLPANKALNIAGNGNQASNTLSVLADLTPPVIAAGQSFNVLQTSPAGTTVGSVTATDAAGTLQNWAITTDPTGGGFAINGSGAIRVNNTSLLASHAGSTLTLLVRVSDGLNNSTPTAVQVTVIAVNQPPTLDPIRDESLCATTEIQTIQLTGISAGEPTQTWSFSFTADQSLLDAVMINAGVLSYQLKPTFTAGSTTITVTIRDNGGTANGGVDELKRTFTITVKPVPVITITSDKGTTVSKGEVVHLTATGGNRYNWANASGIISGQQSARLEIRPQANTTYQVTASNSGGCNNTASIAISVVEDFKIDALNIITPNGDGKNDKWVVRNLDSYPDNEVKIYDRAGRLVYQRRNYNNDWDGTTNGHPLAEGVYYYILTIGSKSKTAKGAITIIRDRY